MVVACISMNVPTNSKQIRVLLDNFDILLASVVVEARSLCRADDLTKLTIFYENTLMICKLTADGRSHTPMLTSTHDTCNPSVFAMITRTSLVQDVSSSYVPVLLRPCSCLMVSK